MASAQPTDFVEKVRSAIDLVALISESVPLKRAGRKFRGLCPFHSEKTPSFYLDEEKGLFYCFGCQTGGDVFKFVMLRENVEFLEAARLLAHRLGIPVTARSPGRRSRKEAILVAHREAAAFYHEMLKSGPEAAAARKYLRARGMTAETVGRLGIGYAPDRWDALKGHMAAKGFPVDLLIAGGLLVRKQGGSSSYDRFRNRVVFPIRNLSGEVVGFGGRIIGPGEPKYLNSSDSPAYAKREVLYGLDLTRGNIRDRNEAIVVEGYFDFASLLQSGVSSVVATLGTAFSKEQAGLLRRFADKVVMNYDPDDAGSSATRRSIELLLSHGFKVRVLELEGRCDPDEFIRSKGAEVYHVRVAAAPRHFEYLLAKAVAGQDIADYEVKSRVVKQVLPALAGIPDRIERAGCVNTLAERLGIEDDLMLSEIREALGRTRPAQRTVTRAPGPAVRFREAEGRLVRGLVEERDLRAAVLAQLDPDDLAGSPIEDIVRAMRGLETEGSEVSYTRLSEVLEEPARSLLAKVAMEPGPVVSRDEAVRCVQSIRLRRLRRERDRLQKEMEEERGTVRLDDLMRRKIALSRQIDSLA